MSELKDRAYVVAGALALAAVGRDRFYHLAQSGSGVLGRVARAFCEGHAARVAGNYAIYLEDRDRDGLSSIAARYYGDDSLHGYGDTDFTRADGKPLLEQDRGLVIPLVEQGIVSDAPRTVVEIGAANGDVLAYLAARHPDVAFVGVDLSVKNAEAKHRLPNLTFVGGYPLELLETGRVKGEVVFGGSTFCVATGREFARYMAAMRDVKRLIVKDPVTFGNRHTGDPRPWSRHMDLYMWFHNYHGYLREAGFTIDHYETRGFHYTQNPNARFVLISGVRR